MRHVEHVMGTVFSFDVRHSGPGDAGQALTEAVAWLHRVDAVFSTYRPDSPVSRLGRGEIDLADCPPEVAGILDLCDAVTELSHGYFTAYPRGRLDPSAMVKGWAIERASDILTRSGAVDHCVNGGGDIQLAGTAAPGCPWRTGIAHPLLRANSSPWSPDATSPWRRRAPPSAGRTSSTRTPAAPRRSWPRSP
ncbi:thiamine biosynthesis lipoprotein ApbE [Streptosporangium album]|uniref:FAD:protein FMN transferase n=1 Tax=Streptosporangium album TaxID=47479 RepID=A0A7W7RSV5_9ACTN|nr:thiamine biosynthesis lipoprotein ApbE [Streptosporangium album]